ncbi:hypothetical protein JW926_08090 [Candidatus Sumerlaeota bacterium]|nr:hypothetical protein [Candidatus Sumerlaeota bacterium]
MARRNIYIFLIVLFLLSTRVPFHSKYFFHWDTVQYAYGSQKYNFTLHHAHPPGYWAYVQIIALLNLLIKDYNLTIILINLICSVVVALCLFETGRQFRNLNLGLILTGMFLLSPVLWLYSVISLNHLTLTVLPAVFLHYYIRKEPPTFPEYLMMSLLAGFWAGIRLVETFLLLPFCLFLISRHPKPLKVFLSCILVFTGAFLFWFLPFIKDAGGWSNYQNVSRLYYTSICHDKSILYGASLLRHVSFFPRAILWLAADFGIFGLGALSALFLAYCNKKKIIYPFAKKDSFALLFGILPLTIFYLAVYIGRPAYWFTLLPFLFFILSAVFYSTYEKYERKGAMHALLLVLGVSSLLYFIIPGFLYHRIFTREINKPAKQQSCAGLERFVGMTRYSWAELRHRDNVLKIVVEGLGEFAASKNSQCFGYIDFGGVIDWRRCSYYLPQIPFATVVENKIPSGSSPMALLAGNHQVEYLMKKKNASGSNGEFIFHTAVPDEYGYFMLIPDASSNEWEEFRESYHPVKIPTPLNLEIYVMDMNEIKTKAFSFKEMSFYVSEEERVIRLIR